MPYRGITAPELKALLRPILADPAHRIAERGDWERAVRDLWDGATHREERYAATALTGHRTYRAWQDPDTLPLYRHLVVTGAWWDHVDEVASNRIGPILLSHNEEVTPIVVELGERRRPVAPTDAIISQLTFKERTDLGLLRAAIEPNLDGHQLLDPQGDRVGAAAVRAHRPRLGAGDGGRVRRPAERTEPARGAQAPLRRAVVDASADDRAGDRERGQATRPRPRGRPRRSARHPTASRPPRHPTDEPTRNAEISHANASVVVPGGASRSTSWKTQVSTGGRPRPLPTVSSPITQGLDGTTASAAYVTTRTPRPSRRSRRGSRCGARGL